MRIRRRRHTSNGHRRHAKRPTRRTSGRAQKMASPKKLPCRSYKKNVGHGFEVGLIVAGKPVFIGNFIHQNEATRWYNLMRREVRTFSRRFKVGPVPKTWYTRFVGNHLYNRYYNYLDKQFARHTQTYGRAITQNVRQYRQLNRRWYPAQKTQLLRAA